MSGIFSQVKEQVDVPTVARAYGLKLTRNDMTRCPFHKDRNPSLKLNRNYYHCFGCQVSGDAIDFVSRLFGISQIDAAKKMVVDFNLKVDEEIDYQSNQSVSFTPVKSKLEHKPMTLREKRYEIEKNIAPFIRRIFRLRDNVENTFKSIDSLSPEEVFTDDFVGLVSIYNKLEYWIDVLLFGEDYERETFEKYYAEEVTSIEKAIKYTRECILRKKDGCFSFDRFRRCKKSA